MKKIITTICILLATACGSFAQLAVPTEIKASFRITEWSERLTTTPVVENLDFGPSLEGSFSLDVDVPVEGFYHREVPLSSFYFSQNRFGATTFSLVNVGAAVYFVDGQLSLLLLGGLPNGINAVASSLFPVPGTPSDFVLVLVPGPQAENSFLYQIDGYTRPLWALSFAANVDVAAATPVPEPTSFTTCTGLVMLGLVSLRMKKREP